MEAKELAKKLKKAIKADEKNPPCSIWKNVASIYRERLEVWKEALEIIGKDSPCALDKLDFMAFCRVGALLSSPSHKLNEMDRNDVQNEMSTWEIVQSALNEIRK